MDKIYSLGNNLKLERGEDTIYLLQDGYYNPSTIASFTIKELEEEIGKLSPQWSLQGLMEDTTCVDGIKNLIKDELATYFLGGTNE